jgi:hypothetical protein
MMRHQVETMAYQWKKLIAAADLVGSQSRHLPDPGSITEKMWRMYREFQDTSDNIETIVTHTLRSLQQQGLLSDKELREFDRIFEVVTETEAKSSTTQALQLARRLCEEVVNRGAGEAATGIANVITSGTFNCRRGIQDQDTFRENRWRGGGLSAGQVVGRILAGAAQGFKQGGSKEQS